MHIAFIVAITIPDLYLYNLYKAHDNLVKKGFNSTIALYAVNKANCDWLDLNCIQTNAYNIAINESNVLAPIKFNPNLTYFNAIVIKNATQIANYSFNSPYYR